MSQPSNPQKKLHPRSLHHAPYDLDALVAVVPELAAYVRYNPKGEKTVDFAEAVAVKLLNQALLLSHYQLAYWDLPSGQLCPPIPGRADYLHYLADLISPSTTALLTGDTVRILDIGVGANLIYPLLGVSLYGWSFVGSDIDAAALAHGEKLLARNPKIAANIRLRKQTNPHFVLRNSIQAGELFDAVICNPPFYSSAEQAYEQTFRKTKNLGTTSEKLVHNFGGQHNELWCKGGEVQLVATMIRESVHFKSQVKWFTSLLASKESLYPLQKLLKKVGASQVQVIPMAQGNKQSRFIAWRFE